MIHRSGRRDVHGIAGLRGSFMFCIHCGAEGAGAFCPKCGRRQTLEGSEQQESASNNGSDSPCTPVSVTPQSVCWTESMHYHVVLASPEPRERIAAISRGAGTGVTGEDLLAVFDAVSPIGISLGKLTNAILPIYDKLGIRIDRESHAVFDAPAGRVILAVLCTLASKSLTIEEVGQDEDRCSLSAKLPWGLMTNPGKLHVLIATQAPHIRVSVATRISGQWYDFGKSQRMIDELLEAIQNDLASQATHPSSHRRVA